MNNGNTKDCKFIKWFWQWKLKICNKKEWYVIDSESKGNCSQDDPIKFLTKSLESSDYSDAYILVTGNVTATPNNAVTQVVFRNCGTFKNCRTEINDIFFDNTDFILQCLCIL